MKKFAFESISKISVLSPAKINLFLHIVGRKPNGYHLLQTIFQFIDLCDHLQFTLRKDQTLELQHQTQIPVEQNLIIKAARLLQARSKTSYGATIVLDKVIPEGAGLGGGSSNAASTLLALNQLWQLNFSQKELLSMALELGADVPIFVFGQNAFAEGIGEQLTPITLLPQWYIIIKPNCSIRTAEIFQHPRLPRNTPAIRPEDYHYETTHNDFQELICELYPEVAESLATLNEFGQARLTGTGACLFLPVKDKESGEKIIAALNKKYSAAPVPYYYWLCQGLDQAPPFLASKNH